MTNAEETLKMVCALTDKEFAQRRKMVRTRLLPAVTKVGRTESAVIFEFADKKASRSDVELFAALEGQCCGFLDFRLSSQGEPLSLTISGPKDAKPVLDAFVAAASQ